MKQRWLTIGLVLIAAAILLAACDRSESTVRKTVENAARATQTALGTGSLEAVRPFFASVAEGANEAGIDETWGALQRFANALDSSSRVQFHSFDVENVTVHENGGLARASYKLHLSVLRNGEVTFGAVITQNLALIKTIQGWKISGGDEPQLSEVQGQWPSVTAP